MTQQVFDFRSPQSAHASGKPRWVLERPVFFVGFMGAGKTSVARKLARYAGVAAIDMDTYIERRCDMKVKEIFAQSGEAGFRAIETDVLRELATGEPLLVSCGGGVVLADENRSILKEHGYVVYLRVTAAEAASRISDLSTRPLFGNLDQAQRIIESRLPLYEDVADMEVDTAGRSSGSIANRVFDILKKAGVVHQLPAGNAFGGPTRPENRSPAGKTIREPSSRGEDAMRLGSSSRGENDREADSQPNQFPAGKTVRSREG